MEKENKTAVSCPVLSKCGACKYLEMEYGKQLKKKEKYVQEILKPFCKVNGITGMEKPFYYRNKVTRAFGMSRNKVPVFGIYEEKSHKIVQVDKCFIEDEKAGEIIKTIFSLLRSFKIRVYDEDTGYGLLRYVMVRKAFATGEYMVVLVTASPVFPSKQNFCKALRQKHPEITTIVQNINFRTDSLVLSDKENVLYGKGFIEDRLCGKLFKLSSRSFYQVNPVQTEILYKKAIDYAGLTGKEIVLDAYSGIGTIGIIAADRAGKVISVEVNRDAVRDAVTNAKKNNLKNITFYAEDAGSFMEKLSEDKAKTDVVFMDPPRQGASKEFIDALLMLKPAKIVYISCGPESLGRDLELLTKGGYVVKKAECVDMFPQVNHVEACALLGKASDSEARA